MSAETDNQRSVARYAPLGLIANPFETPRDSVAPATDCDINSKSNMLLKALLERSQAESPKPLWIEKGEGIPTSYYMLAMANAEKYLAVDDDLNIMYALVELYTMRVGVTRSTLRILSERLAFRSFDRTLAAYLKKVVTTPDTTLASYQVMGPEVLAEFEAKFEADPIAAVHEYLGEPVDERRPEFSEAVDYRPLSMDEDVADETDTSVEVDATITDAPGTGALLSEHADEEGEGDAVTAVRDYLIEYTSTHLSSVIARAVRVYCDRGLVAMASEFTVTKAPRKTLTAVVQFALMRFRKVVVLFDSFDQWLEIDSELRAKLVSAMSEMRWKLAGSALLAYFVEPGTAPELEETFRGDDQLDWTYSELAALQESGDSFDADTANMWLRAASLDDAAPVTVADPGYARLVEEADGSWKRFVKMAYVAIEYAATMGSGVIDDDACEAAVEALAAAEAEQAE